jgi:ethanolamine ammonia-lyase large subunit
METAMWVIVGFVGCAFLCGGAVLLRAYLEDHTDWID